MQQVSNMFLANDLKASSGNFFVDVDGNKILDCFMHIASLPLGYNHPALVEAMSNPDNVHLLANRPTLGWFPHAEWTKHMTDVLMSVAPKGLDHVYALMCGTCANENALKLAFFRYAQLKRGESSSSYTEEEFATVLENRGPGAPKFSILGFRQGFHGRSLTAFSCAISNPAFAMHLPRYDWPQADFPRYRYPLEEFERENAAEDARCLATVEDAIETYRKKGQDVAGVIIEPIQAEGGDHHCSKAFLGALAKICKKNDASFIVDEVQTGGGSAGAMWAHELFDLPHAPDLVTFSKKMLSGGVYHNLEHRPEQALRIANTWMGDPHKILLLGAALDVIKRERLLDTVRESGNILMDGLKRLEAQFPGQMAATRGLGTLIAFDCPGGAEPRLKMRDAMLRQGVLIGVCGEKTVRLRPALIFQPEHANIFLEKFEGVLKTL